MSRLAELRDKREEALKVPLQIREAARAEERDFTDEENVKFDKAMEDVDRLEAEYSKAEAEEQRIAKLEAAQSKSAGRKSSPDKVGDDDSETRSDTDKEKRATEVRDRAICNWFGYGIRNLTPEESRALSQSKTVEGGYLSPDVKFQTELIQAVDNLVFMRQFGTQHTVDNADSMGTPSLENDPADPTWTSELSIGAEDSTMDLGKRELTPHPLAQFIKVSKKLLRTAALNPEALVRERLAYKQAVVQETAFMTGDGSNSPLGIFTASANGIPTSRDQTAASNTAIVADELIDVQFSVKPQYHARSRWVMHRDVLKAIRKLKLSDGQYIWQTGLSASNPGTILDSPYSLSEYAPNTFTTGLYMLAYGDFSFYWIADALGMEIQRLDELYAAANQVGFITRSETDGMPVLAEAFARLILN